MELSLEGRGDLADTFVEAYLRASGDQEGRMLLPFYRAYRAAVRGKVEGMKLAEPEVPEADKATARARARARWLFALAELEVPRSADPAWCSWAACREAESRPWPAALREEAGLFGHSIGRGSQRAHGRDAEEAQVQAASRRRYLHSRVERSDLSGMSATSRGNPLRRRPRAGRCELSQRVAAAALPGRRPTMGGPRVFDPLSGRCGRGPRAARAPAGRRVRRRLGDSCRDRAAMGGIEHRRRRR